MVGFHYKPRKYVTKKTLKPQSCFTEILEINTPVVLWHTFDKVRVQHLGLFKFENGIFGVPCSEVHIGQAHQEVHVVPQQRLFL